jgi:hypothetical protein
MNVAEMFSFPKFDYLPKTMRSEGAVTIELVEGVPIFRAASIIQRRIEALLDKQKASRLNAAEEEELARYEEIDDYLSYVNRLVRNLFYNSNE